MAFLGGIKLMTDTAAGAVSRKSTATAEQMNFKTKEGIWKVLVIACGLLMIVLPLAIGAFLIYRGSATFTKYGHSVLEFLFSSDWNPADDMSGGGKVGAAVYIVGSLLTCGLALLISVPFSMAAAIFMTEIAPKTGNKVLRPAVEIFVGIPSVVYGWIGLTILESNRPSKKSILIELSLFFEDDHVLIIERDSGKLFDLTDPDAEIKGLSGFTLSGLMKAHNEKAYLVTTGYNRNMMRFSRA